MITILHISIALASVAYLAASLMSLKLYRTSVAWLSVSATLLSGIILMILQPATAAHVCVSGSIYLAVSVVAITFARTRKAKYFTA